MTSLLIVGGGKMGTALLGGLLTSGWIDRADVVVVEPVAERRAELEADFAGLRTCSAPEPGLLDDGGERPPGALLATKPDVAEGACRALGVTGVTRVLSIVAGVPTQRLESALGGQPAVVRAMPNTPALVGAGVTASRAAPSPPRPIWHGPKTCSRPWAPWCGCPSASSMP
jgi:pyrroline-5-carboxylate reductase